jgi:hypothetical protein
MKARSSAVDDEVERLRDFARSMLDPERFGHAVTAEVRDEARELLGLRRVEIRCRLRYVATADRCERTEPDGTVVHYARSLVLKPMRTP